MWGKCPPFQVDSSLGGTAGVAEMLLQSHEGYIYPLPALPKEWGKGSFHGLVARGNFIVSIAWNNHRITAMNLQAVKGGICNLYLTEVALDRVKIRNTEDKIIDFQTTNSHVISFETQKSMTYFIEF